MGPSEHSRTAFEKPPSPRIGIALGGGSARGWAHIGVLAALSERGIEPEIVCGTSIGALVGGIYAAGKLAELEAWVTALSPREVLGLVDFTVTGGGMIGGRRLLELYEAQVGAVRIEELPCRYAAVATDLESGAEVWLQDGLLSDAIRASISIPGIFTPVRRNGRWLVDGGLVNPVPVTVCRALGADVVIGVDLHGASKHQPHSAQPEDAQPAVIRARTGRRPFGGGPGRETDDGEPPGLAAIVQTALDIMQIRISRSRLAGDPPDLLLRPRVLQIPSLEFARGGPTIEEGRNVVRRMMPALNDLLGREPA